MKKKCRYEGCEKPSAKGKTVCWMHSKREYRANKKLKSEWENSGTELSFDEWKGLKV
jgi:hypothetical protein